MAVVLLLICSISLRSIGANVFEPVLTAPWGVNYTKRNPYMEGNAQIYSPTFGQYLTDSDIGPGAMRNLTNGKVPTNFYPNQDGDIQRIDECVAPNDLTYYASPGRGLEYIVTFNTTFEIYRADITFAWDFPSGTNYYVPPLSVVYMKTDDGTQIKDTATDYYTEDWSDSSLVGNDWKLWQSDVPTTQADAPITKSLSFYIHGGTDCILNSAHCHFLICQIDVYGYRVTAYPTTSPTKNPTINPTITPSKSPTNNPTDNPTNNPTITPSKSPTNNPTRSPTMFPTSTPSTNPTTFPTVTPSANPTIAQAIEIVEIAVEPKSGGCYVSIVIPSVAIGCFLIFIVVFILRSIAHPPQAPEKGEKEKFDKRVKTLAVLHICFALLPPIIQTNFKKVVSTGVLMIICGSAQIIFHFIKHYVSSKNGEHFKAKSAILFVVVGTAIFNISQGTSMIAGVDFGKSGIDVVIATTWVSFLGQDVLSNVLEFVITSHERWGCGVVLIFVIGFAQRVSNIYLYGQYVSLSNPMALFCQLSKELSSIVLVIEVLYLVAGVLVFCKLYSMKDDDGKPDGCASDTKYEQDTHPALSDGSDNAATGRTETTEMT